MKRLIVVFLLIPLFSLSNAKHVKLEDDLARKKTDLVKVRSKRGSIILEAKVVDVPRDGVVYTNFHYSDKLIKILTNDAYDALSRQLEYKISANALIKL